jgi:hypothetical protein
MAAAPPAAEVTNLNTFSTGVMGTKFKKGDTWIVGPADWQNKKVGINTPQKLVGKPAAFKDITYINYDLEALKGDGFPKDSIKTLNDKYKIGKTARLYAKTAPQSWTNWNLNFRRPLIPIVRLRWPL